jgi:hypothetical protein
MNRKIEKRANEILKSMKATCDCGGDPNYPGWHEERCSTESAWDRAMGMAEDQIAEEEEVMALEIRRSKP